MTTDFGDVTPPIRERSVGKDAFARDVGVMHPRGQARHQRDPRVPKESRSQGNSQGQHRFNEYSNARLRTDQESVRLAVGGAVATLPQLRLSAYVAQFTQDAADDVCASASGSKSYSSAVTLIRAYAPIPTSPPAS